MDNHKLGTRDDYENYLRGYRKDRCPFCDWPHEQIVLHEGHNWIWIYNRFPYWKNQTMLVPKRHFKEITDMSLAETAEMIDMYKFALNRFRERGIGDKYVMFWRLRDRMIDSISGNKRPDHFHINLVTDKDHLWDPLIDPEAIKCDPNKLMDERG